MPVEKISDDQLATDVAGIAVSGPGGSSALPEQKDVPGEKKQNIKITKKSTVPELVEVPKKIGSEVINIIPEEVSKKYNMAVFGRDADIISVAMLDPENISALNALRFVAEKEGLRFQTFSASEKILGEIRSFYYGPGEMIKKAVKSFQEDTDSSGSEKEGSASRREEILKEAPVTKLVEVVISHAIDGKASDIHIEPMEGDYRVRFRVDGVLHVSLIIPIEIGPAIISRVKIMANLKIDEKRKPQDGRFRLDINGKNIDFRVSSLPVMDGEKIVMRILDKDSGVATVEALGLAGTALEKMKVAIAETYGMILITGPTGSGKSTTLYALLKILNNEERNIVTLEDPVEYNIEGLNQSQIKPEIGYTFASGLRTVLRQDPNVIMVGEIRDSETAELAVHAALTGHLMFSTLHTNTAIGAIPRMIDMGIEPFLLSSSLRIVVAQRLVRKICEYCKEEITLPPSVFSQIEKIIAEIPPEEMPKIGLDVSGGMKFYRGKGCDKCGGTGLKGRVAIFEVVPVNETVRDIITEKKGNEDLIVQERDRLKFLTIKQDGVVKILKGLTTIEEVERVIEGRITLAEEND